MTILTQVIEHLYVGEYLLNKQGREDYDSLKSGDLGNTVTANITKLFFSEFAGVIPTQTIHPMRSGLDEGMG